MVSVEGIAKLKAWRQRQAFGLMGLGLALVGLSVALGLWALPGFAFFINPVVILLPLSLIWIWALWPCLGRYQKAAKDLSNGTYMRTSGVASLRQTGGVGLLAPKRHMLDIGDKSFEISAAFAQSVSSGQSVIVTHGLASNFVLDIASLAKA